MTRLVRLPQRGTVCELNPLDEARKHHSDTFCVFFLHLDRGTGYQKCRGDGETVKIRFNVIVTVLSHSAPGPISV